MTTFLKLYHDFFVHEKHAELSNDALLLHISGLMYASERLTDGRLPKSPMVRLSWSTRLTAAGADVDALIAELIEAGVWLDEWPERYEIANYLEHNRSKEQVAAVRRSNRDRKRKQRNDQNTPSDADPDPEPDGLAESHAESHAESQRDITVDRTTSLPLLRAVRSS